MRYLQIATDCFVFDRFCFCVLFAYFDESMDVNFVGRNNFGNNAYRGNFNTRPFLRTIGAIIDMKEGNIRFQCPLRKGMEHFQRNKVKLPYESIMRATYESSAKDGTR